MTTPQNMEKEKLVQKFNEDWPSTHSYTAGKMTDYIRDLVDTAHSLGEKAMLEKAINRLKYRIDVKRLSPDISPEVINFAQVIADDTQDELISSLQHLYE